MGKTQRPKPRTGSKLDADPIICSCNGIRLSEILAVIQRGVHDVRTIGYATTAGQGECGGTCQPLLQKIIAQEIKK